MYLVRNIILLYSSAWRIEISLWMQVDGWSGRRGIVSKNLHWSTYEELMLAVPSFPRSVVLDL
jgi:hypothetical protein